MIEMSKEVAHELDQLSIPERNPESSVSAKAGLIGSRTMRDPRAKAWASETSVRLNGGRWFQKSYLGDNSAGL